MASKTSLIITFDVERFLSPLSNLKSLKFGKYQLSSHSYFLHSSNSKALLIFYKGGLT